MSSNSNDAVSTVKADTPLTNDKNDKKVEKEKVHAPFLKSLFTFKFNDMSIMHRVYLCQGLCVLLFAIATAFVIYLNFEQDRISEAQNIDKLQNINTSFVQASDTLSVINKAVYDLSFAKNIDENKNIINENANTLVDSMARLTDVINSIDNDKLRQTLVETHVESFEKTTKDYIALISEIGNALVNDPDKAHNLAHKATGEYVLPLFTCLQAVQADTSKNLLQNSNRATNTLRNAQFYLIAAFLIVLVTSALTLLTIRISLRKNTGRLLKALSLIAKGHLHTELKINSQDEIGNISRLVNCFVTNSKDTLSTIKNDINKLHDVVAQNSQAIETTNQALFDQRNKAQDVCASTALMESSVAKVTEFAKSTLEEVKNAEDASDTCRRTMQDNITTTHSLSDRLRATSNAITEVNAMGDQIDSIVKTIADIADQTNLLALNANIEAARSGEYGRGFAIVADEIRSLATKTAHSTKEVTNTIKELRAAVSNSVNVMASCEGEMENSLQQSSRANSSIEEIMGFIATISDMSEQIVESCQQQTNSASEINLAIANIQKLTEDTYVHMSQIHTTMAALDSLAYEQSMVIDKFKLENDKK